MMKRVFLVVLIIFSFMIISLNISAASWRYEWENTTIYIPVHSSLENYKNIPKAILYKDNIVVEDAKISYLTEGDWLYYLSDVNTSILGEYEVWYKAYENTEYRPGTCLGYKCKIKFIVVDEIPPKIEVIEPIVKLRRNSDFDVISNVRVSDNYYQDLTITSTNNIDFKKVGSYIVKVYVEDGSYNYSSIEYVVEIYENNYPYLIYKDVGNSLKIPLNGKIDFSDFFEAYDEIDGDLSNYINYPNIDTSLIGQKEYTFSVTNFAGLTSSINVVVEIVDDAKPEIEIIGSEIIVLDYTINFEEYDFKKHIMIHDNTTVDYSRLSIFHNIENKVGSYTLWYSYTDLTYVVTKSAEVKLRSYTKPEIIVEDIVCYEDCDIDLKDFITIVDLSDENVIDSLVIYDENVDYSTEGTYYAEAYAINSSGLSTTSNFKVIVNDSNPASSIKTNFKIENINNTQIILIIIISILIGIIIFQVWKIKKHKSI